MKEKQLNAGYMVSFERYCMNIKSWRAALVAILMQLGQRVSAKG